MIARMVVAFNSFCAASWLENSFIVMNPVLLSPVMTLAVMTVLSLSTTPTFALNGISPKYRCKKQEYHYRESYRPEQCSSLSEEGLDVFHSYSYYRVHWESSVSLLPLSFMNTSSNVGSTISTFSVRTPCEANLFDTSVMVSHGLFADISISSSLNTPLNSLRTASAR